MEAAMLYRKPQNKLASKFVSLFCKIKSFLFSFSSFTLLRLLPTKPVIKSKTLKLNFIFIVEQKMSISQFTVNCGIYVRRPGSTNAVITSYIDRF